MRGSFRGPFENFFNIELGNADELADTTKGAESSSVRSQLSVTESALKEKEFVERSRILEAKLGEIELVLVSMRGLMQKVRIQSIEFHELELLRGEEEKKKGA